MPLDGIFCRAHCRLSQLRPPNSVQAVSPASSVNDFDFLVGRWNVLHHRLKERLAGSTQWDDFTGTSTLQKLMDGQANVDDNLINLPSGPYRAASLRSFDPNTRQWAIWWLDARDPHHPLDPPVVGSFSRNIGTFYADDTFKGHPIRVRYLWSDITPSSCHWEQAFSPDGGKTWETNWIMDFTRVQDGAAHAAGSSSDFAVVELRRYTIKEGERDRFARDFEAFFPEAIQQTGAIVAGEFLERDRSSAFTWIRGFRDMDERAKSNAALYYGAVWKEHRVLMNSLMLDSDDVLLLKPLAPGRGVPILPAVDPVREAQGARGIVVAQIFRIQPDGVDAFVRQAAPAFTAYRATGAREAGVLVTLDAKNNFPQLPIRSDGPYLVWLGILQDEQILKTSFRPLAQRLSQALAATGLLQGAPELVVLDPAQRSRLRWLASEQT
jgi:hypothetical protein